MNRKSYKMLSNFLLVTMFLAPLVNSSETIKIVNLKKNFKTFNDWACNTPQPRVVHIDDLDEYVAPNAIYFPSALVIHQCDQSTGCCKIAGQVCKSFEPAEEQVRFAVRAVSNNASGADSPLPDGKTRTKSVKKEKKLMVTLTNHTRCECVGKVDLRT